MLFIGVVFLVFITSGMLTGVFVFRYLSHKADILMLEEQRDQNHAIAENLPGVVFQWIQSEKGKSRFRYCSDRSKVLFGFNANDVLTNWKHLNLFDRDESAFLASFKVAAREFTKWSYEGRILIDQMDFKWIRGFATPQYSSDGDILFTGVLIDITDQKEAQEEMMQAHQNAQDLSSQLFEVNQILEDKNHHLSKLNQLKSEFLSMAAHDLKNPLNGVSGIASILRDMLKDDADLKEAKHAEYDEMISFIQSSADHMSEIITATLNSEALEHGSLFLDRKLQDMEKIALHVVRLNQNHADEKSIRINYLTDGNILAPIDGPKIREVMDNLVSNAVKYSPKGSEVTVQLQHAGSDMVLFSVKDHGPGISEKDMPKLFGRFQKLSARPTGGESSTGLGLSIVKTIVELHQGKVWCESKPGKGSIFKVEIPLFLKLRDLDHASQANML